MHAAAPRHARQTVRTDARHGNGLSESQPETASPVPSASLSSKSPCLTASRAAGYRLHATANATVPAAPCAATVA